MTQVEAAGKSVRMAKPERRASLLAAAREVFGSVGYHSAAMDDIAERAGVSKPVLYQHFPSKLDLYLALLDEGIDSLTSAVADALRSTSDNKLRVQATVAAYFTFVANPDSGFRLVFESDLTSEPQVREKVEHASNEHARMIADVIATDTNLSSEEALLLGSGMLGTAQIAALRWLANGEQLPREDAAALIASLSWRGIASFPLSEHDSPAR